MNEFEIAVIVLLLMIWAQNSQGVKRMATRLEIWRRLIVGRIREKRSKVTEMSTNMFVTEEEYEEYEGSEKDQER